MTTLRPSVRRSRVVVQMSPPATDVAVDTPERSRAPSTATYEQAMATPESLDVHDDRPHLTDDRRCKLFGKPERPQTCVGLRPGPEMCGGSVEEAMATLLSWETLTTPRKQ